MVASTTSTMVIPTASCSRGERCSSSGDDGSARSAGIKAAPHDLQKASPGRAATPHRPQSTRSPPHVRFRDVLELLHLRLRRRVFVLQGPRSCGLCRGRESMTNAPTCCPEPPPHRRVVQFTLLAHDRRLSLPVHRPSTTTSSGIVFAMIRASCEALSIHHRSARREPFGSRPPHSRSS